MRQRGLAESYNSHPLWFGHGWHCTVHTVQWVILVLTYCIAFHSLHYGLVPNIKSTVWDYTNVVSLFQTLLKISFCWIVYSALVHFMYWTLTCAWSCKLQYSVSTWHRNAEYFLMPSPHYIFILLISARWRGANYSSTQTMWILSRWI